MRLDVILLCLADAPSDCRASQEGRSEGVEGSVVNLEAMDPSR